ncbi:hypothetical protein HPB51_020351 [Rhipicephalus microplus]|uniref:Uncharacterized protein n=1 Tax=Rhipicephalus microplus TaxID=6941 RepID=A0A9J6DW11_RHIMP|nr:hypothetical protein HPB51_020351 [Rhipicephalus microplus]
MVQCEVTQKAAVCEVPPEKCTRVYYCDMQSDSSIERKEQQVVVSEIVSREGTGLSDDAKVVHVESGTVAGMRTVASPKGVPCETEAGSSRPDKVIEEIDELETTLEPQQGNDLSDVKREDNEGSPNRSEHITLLKPDSTVSEGELRLKVSPTDSVGNATEGAHHAFKVVPADSHAWLHRTVNNSRPLPQRHFKLESHYYRTGSSNSAATANLDPRPHVDYPIKTDIIGSHDYKTTAPVRAALWAR